MRYIPVGQFDIGAKERNAILSVLDSGRISEGAVTAAFEKEWASYVGTRFAVAVNSGTSALLAGILACAYHYRLPKGSKILTSPLTFIATANAITLNGFTPVFADTDPRTFVITPESILRTLKREKGVRAILPVHLMGYPADMDAIRSIARRKGLLLLEDAAQAHGTRYKGKRTGSLALMGFFSFYIAHNIQAGEMGAVTTDDAELYGLLKKIKAHGRICDCRVCTRNLGTCPHAARTKHDPRDIDPRFSHDILGYNFKTMEFTAALARTQLTRAEAIFNARSRNVAGLNSRLKDLGRYLQLPVFDRNVSYLAYPVVLKKTCPLTRKEVRDHLARQGIETRPLFGCIPTQQPVYGHLAAHYRGRVPNAEYAGSRGFYLGCHQYLRSSDLDRIAQAFERIFS